MMESRTMIGINTTKHMIAVTGLLAGLALAGPTAFAQTSVPTAPNQGGATMGHPMPGQGGMMPGMMSGDMQQQMSRMMDACTRMTEPMTPHQGGPLDKKG